MKKIILSLLVLTTFLPTIAAAKTIINHSNKASPGTIVAKSFESSLGDSTVSFYQASNCVEAQKKFETTKDAVMIFNADVGIAALSKKLNCPLKAQAKKTIFIGKSYLKVCTNVSNTNNIFKARTMGMASVILSKGIIADWNSEGIKVKGVPYGGSKGVLQALIANDIDYGYVASSVAGPAEANGLIRCDYTTDFREAKFLGNHFKKIRISTMPIVKVFYTNSNDPKFIAKLRQAVVKDEFKKFLNTAAYSDVKTNDISTQDINNVKKFINDSYNLYWK
jgi:hypothetical protein